MYKKILFGIIVSIVERVGSINQNWLCEYDQDWMQKFYPYLMLVWGAARQKLFTI